MTIELCRIDLYKPAQSNQWVSIPVMAIDDDSFTIASARARLTLRDEELKPDEEGRTIIDLAPLDLKFYFPEVDLPKTFEMPATILKTRAEKRRLNRLAKDSIAMVPYQGEMMYFYLEGEKLRILHGEKEVTAEKIEIIHGRKAVNVEGLELGHQYFELPANVASEFETVLKAQELKKLCLISVGKNLLTGKECFRFSCEVPEYMFEPVEPLFEYVEDIGVFSGFVTSEALKVSFALGIPIQKNN